MKATYFKLAALAASFLTLAACDTLHGIHSGATRSNLEKMRKVADWQLAHPSKHPPLDWTQGALYPGLLALDGIQPDAKYREAVRAVGKASQFASGPRRYHADDYAVAQSFLELYTIYRERACLMPTVWQFDSILAKPAACSATDIRSCNSKKPGGLATPMRWWWCDSLFMAGPSWARAYAATGDSRYLDFLVKEWEATSDALYDKDEHLFFRDSNYFPSKKREANGKKIFWSRGNGWVIAGLARVLQYLPENYPERAFFEKQFKEMAARLIAIQPADGVWRASLLDPASYPLEEASGTGFICYALTWGVNQGLLDRKTAEPAARKAYSKLCSFVTPEGKLTHVQPIGADPKAFHADSTEVYGVGAFLLAGTEWFRAETLAAHPHAIVTAKNSSALFLPQQTMELPWSFVLEKCPDAEPDALAVMDFATSRFLTTQVLYDTDGKTPTALLFQTDLLPKQDKRFILVSGIEPRQVPQPALSTFARYVPERKDDFAWENDRAAYRAYGPALWTVDGARDGKPAATGNGIDIWGKRDRPPMINRIFKEPNYHSAKLGYGIDCYKVGTGPGCGGSGVVAQDGHIAQAITYSHWKLIASGPIRAIFALSYAPFPVSSKSDFVGEVRYFMMDLGTPFFRVTSVFSDPVTPAVGLTWRPATPASGVSGEGWAACWEPGDGHVPYQMGVALIVPKGETPSAPVKDARWICAKPGDQITAYAGGVWSGGQDAHNAREWFAQVEAFRQRLGASVSIH